ncbi:MAG: hypothetical protein M3O85_05985 [Acidobacteriota bacterium]|nr:hypothetical protein [Acidobacteriota bacterium]
MYRILDRANARRGFSLILLLGASLLAFGQNSPEKRGGPDESDNPSKRAQWFLRGRTVHGKSAADQLRRAHQQKLQIRQQTLERMERAAAQASQSSPGSSATAPAGGVVPMTVPAGSAWVNLGPAPITSLGRFGDASGRIPAIAVDQNDSTGNTVYVGGAYGGVWKSTNAANLNPSLVTWTPIYDNDPAAATLAVGAITLQPNSSVILVGTGEPNNAVDSYYGMGILRSTNGGISWTLITTAVGGQAFKGMGVSKFAWSSTNPSLVVAGFSNTPLGGALNAGGGFQGLYYSTDAGATWTLATNATAGDTIFGSASDVVYNVTLGKFFAALRKQGIYSSTNGSSWTRLTNQPVTFAANCSNGGAPTCDMLRGQLTVRPGSAEMYAWILGTDGTTNRGISRTTDGGATGWSATAVGSGPGALSITGITTCGDTGGCGTSQGFYDLVLTAVPNGDNTDLYAGAVNLFKCQNSNSTTCATWLNLTHVYGSCSNNTSYLSIHPDQHAIEFLQSNTNIIYFGNDGGAYRSLTSKSAGSAGLNSGVCTSGTGNAFQDLNTSSLGSLTQFISISHHPTDDSVILGGTQDNGSPAIASGQASPPLNPPLWYEANGGDGGFNEIDQTSPNNWYTAFTDVTIQRCTTGTNCIETDVFSAVINNDSTAGTVNFNDHGDFYTPYMLDPQLSSKVIIGTCRVWRGKADGTDFATNGPNATANRLSNKLLLAGGTTVCSNSEATYVSSLAAGGLPSAGNGSQVIYAGTANTNLITADGGRIWVTTNATTGIATWFDRTGSINPNNFAVSSIAIDTTDSTGQTAYITIMGFTGGGGHVFKTTNAGVGWTDISAGLPDAPADSVVIDPIDHTIVYVGTDVGVFATNDNGANWSEFGSGLPNVATVALRTFNSGGTKKLRVGTHGRGVWETDLANGSSITVTAPNGGESWAAGSTQAITWNFTGSPGSLVKIDLLKIGRFYTTISSGTSVGSGGSGSFSWAIPLGLPAGNDYSVQVTSTSDASITDTSNADFTVQ